MIPVDAQFQISVTLKAEEWNNVLFVMGESPVPYRMTAPIIQAIGSQIQSAAQFQAAAAEAAPKPNGAAERPQYVPVA